jgi:hypothetical protein
MKYGNLHIRGSSALRNGCQPELSSFTKHTHNLDLDQVAHCCLSL